MTSVSFQSKFDAWLDGVLSEPMPSHIAAFCFNLAEPWCIEVIGAERFDETDPDWPCDEIFRPKTKELWLPDSEVGSKWQAVLESAKGLVTSYLDRPSAGSSLLKESATVAIGFVDGDTEILWRK